jgi:putative DNA primase/helicase
VAGKPEWQRFYDDISVAALRRAPAILSEWLPGGSVVRREYQTGSLHGGSGASLKVNLETGRWKDFASGEPGGSNLIALYAAIHKLEWKDATDELAKQFAIEKPSSTHITLAPTNWEPLIPIPDIAPVDDNGSPSLPSLPRSDADAEVNGLWCYFDAEGRPTSWRVRIDSQKGRDVWPLTFCRNRETGEVAWRWKDVPSPRGLYGVEWLAIVADAPILIVEGEKTADAARRLLPDWIVLTWPGGTNRVSTKYTDWSPILKLSNRRIVLWPDADESGVKAMAQLADMLEGRCQVVQPDKLWRKGWDLADAEVERWDTAKVLEYLEAHLVKPRQRPAIERPIVNIAGGDLASKSDAVWMAIDGINSPPWLLSTPTGITVIDRDVFGRGRRQAATLDSLRWALTSRLQFQRYDKDGHPTSTHPPDVLLTNLLVNPRPPLGHMRRLCEVPIVASDGRLISKEGFDAASGIYYLPHPDLAEIELSETPTPSEIEGAVALIDDLLADFPFVEPCDRAHAVAFALVPILRLTINGRTPLFRFEAPQPRTGKSLLMRTLARLSCSESGISDVSPTTDEEEWRKRITGVLRKEPEAFLIDNADSLESAQLKKLLTDDLWEDRQLGSSDTVRYPVQCAFGCSLNNPIISREIMGRSIRVRLDAKSQHPEARGDFRHPNIEEYARQNRAALVGALVTIARASLKLDETVSCLGGYESFCRRMSAVLKAANISGFLGDRKDDSALSGEENALIGLVELWAQNFKDRQVTTADLIRIAEAVEGLYLGRNETDRGKSTALAIFLRKHRGATVGTWKIGDPSPTRPTMWRLSNLNGSTPATPQELEAQGDFSDESGNSRF